MFHVLLFKPPRNVTCSQIKTLSEGVRLTSDVRVGAVHHVCGVYEVVAGALHAQLQLGEAQDQLTPDGKGKERKHAESWEARSSS